MATDNTNDVEGDIKMLEEIYQLTSYILERIEDDEELQHDTKILSLLFILKSMENSKELRHNKELQSLMFNLKNTLIDEED